MRIGVVGGRLQGLEAVYLARKAGWETVVLDREPGVPAAGICDAFVLGDAVSPRDLDAALGGVDLVLPALEDTPALGSLLRWSLRKGIPAALDLKAYSLSASQLASGRLFSKLGVPAPAPWPGCPFPVIAKPDRGSGSRGIRVFRSAEELESGIGRSGAAEGWDIQEYLPGPSYSLEVLGSPGSYRVLQVTDLFMDRSWDCKRVVAPTELEDPQVAVFEDLARTLAEGVGLRGLMDVEVILHEGRLKVLEIDARLPSQTPTAVFWSTGVNMVEMLAQLFLAPGRPTPGPPETPPCGRPRGVVYEHIQVREGVLEVTGEHVMARAHGLRLEEGFFGAPEALTNYGAAGDGWVATLIIAAETRGEALARRERVIAAILDRERIALYRDLEPAP